MELNELQLQIEKIGAALGGMTVNERLYHAGVMDEFDYCRNHNKAKAEQILTLLKVDELSINKILEDIT